MMYDYIWSYNFRGCTLTSKKMKSQWELRMIEKIEALRALLAMPQIKSLNCVILVGKGGDGQLVLVVDLIGLHETIHPPGKYAFDSRGRMRDLMGELYKETPRPFSHSWYGRRLNRTMAEDLIARFSLNKRKIVAVQRRVVSNQ